MASHMNVLGNKVPYSDLEIQDFVSNTPGIEDVSEVVDMLDRLPRYINMLNAELRWIATCQIC
jgi:hypothetical protein